MNNSFLKYLSIFLFFLFCLSPLGAIDLGQGDNSSQINNNGTDLKDLNDTVIDDDRDIKSDNGTDDIKAIDNDVEIQRVSVNDSNSLKLQGHDPKLSMEVEDCVYGESPIVKIYFEDKYFGIAYDQDVFIRSEENGIFYGIPIDHLVKGCNVVKLDDDLPAGNYTVSYSFEYSTYYDNVEVTDVFTIHKRDAAVECSIEDIDYGKKPVLNLNCDNSLGGSVFYITSPYFENGYKFHIPKNPQGPISFELDENLTPRNYIVTFDYQGDHNHNRQLTNVTFKVRKLDSNLTVKAKDYILQGDNLSVEINANKAVNGNATCTLMIIRKPCSLLMVLAMQI